MQYHNSFSAFEAKIIIHKAKDKFEGVSDHKRKGKYDRKCHSRRISYVSDHPINCGK